MPTLASFIRSLRAFVLVLLLPTIAQAQPLAAIAPDTRVRIDLRTAERSHFGRERAQSVTGRVLALEGDTLLLVVRPGSDPVRIPPSAMRAAYVSGGVPHRWQAALRGAVVPALVGAALSAASSSLRRKAGDPTPGEMALSSAAWGAASGAVLGAWSPRERWHRMSGQDVNTTNLGAVPRTKE